MRSFIGILIFVLSVGISPILSQKNKVDAAGPEIQAQVPSKAKLRGRIIYENTGKPIRRAQLRLVSAADMKGDGGAGGTLTDDSGNFEFGAVLAGSYFVLVDLPGVLSPLSFANFYSTGFDRKPAVSRLEGYFNKIVTDGVNESEVLITVKRAAVISGRVTYADGDPAPGVKVELLRSGMWGFDPSEPSNGDSDTGQPDSIITDDRGDYRFPNLPPGKYLVLVRERASHVTEERADYLSLRRSPSSELKTYFPNTGNIDEATVLELEAGGSHENTDITIPEKELFVVTGTIISKADKWPVKGAQLSFSRKTSDAGRVAFSTDFNLGSVATNEKGQWRVKDMPSGEYNVRVEPPRFNGQEIDKNTKAPRKFAATNFVVKIEKKSPENIITELPGEVGIKGTIYLEGSKPFPNDLHFYATSVDEDDDAYGSANLENLEPGKKHSFRIGSLSGGDYKMDVYSEAGIYLLKSVRARSGGPIITVKDDADTEDVEVVLTDRVGTISGVVKDIADNEKVVRVFIMNSSNEDDWNVGVPDASGHFKVTALPGEVYLFVLVTDNVRHGIKTSELKKRIRDEGMRITVKEGETTKLTLDAPKK